jgi:hypothetical protein
MRGWLGAARRRRKPALILCQKEPRDDYHDYRL